MESTEQTFDQITAAIVSEAIICARQSDKWRKPYAAIIQDGQREFIHSVGRLRTPLEAEDERERAELRIRIEGLPCGASVETRNLRNCSHKSECRDVWTRTPDGWRHESITGRNRHGFHK